jgi:hypothetical protein
MPTSTYRRLLVALGLTGALSISTSILAPATARA